MLWNIHADKIARIALFEHENKCVCSHTNCIVAAVIVLTISLFCLLWLVRKLSLLLVLSLVLVLKRQFNELINGKGQRNKHQKSKTHVAFNNKSHIINFLSNISSTIAKTWISKVSQQKNWGSHPCCVRISHNINYPASVGVPPATRKPLLGSENSPRFRLAIYHWIRWQNIGVSPFKNGEFINK